MQRYRINYNWLIGVFATSLVLAITAFFVQRWQVDRKAGSFLDRAEQALAEEKPYEAFESFYKYSQLRPDEVGPRVKMGYAAIEVIKSGEVTSEQLGFAFGILDQTVRTTENPDLRRKLAEIFTIVRPQGAVGHLEILLEDAPNDSELNALLVRSLFGAKDYKKGIKLAFNLIGYDKKLDKFDPEKATLQGESDVYALLSSVLKRRDKNLELARRVIDQMVEANPESPLAHLQKSVFHNGLQEYRAATKHLDKSYELGPKEVAVLSAKGKESLGSNNAGAKSIYEKALSSYDKAISRLLSQDPSALDDPEYKVRDGEYKRTKSEYLEAVSNLERSVPNYEEARSSYKKAQSKFGKAKSQYEEAISKLGSDVEAEFVDKFVQSQDKLNEAQSDFEESLPNYEEAKVFFAAGLEEHPKQVSFYQLLAVAEQRAGRPDEALVILDKGIREFGKNVSIDLVGTKLDVLLRTGDYEGVEQVFKKLALLNRPALQPIIDFQRARVLFSKQQWIEAAKELKRVRPLLFDRPDSQTLAGTMLGVCYERQGMYDLAGQAYATVLNEFPNHSASLLGRNRVNAKLDPEKKNESEINLDEIINEMLALPSEEQDWGKVDDLVEEVIVKSALPIASQKLLRAKVLIKRSKFTEARELIIQAAKDAPENIDIHFGAILLVASDPEQGPAVAVRMLDRLEKKWGSSLRSRAQRADLLVLLNPEDVAEQLRMLVAGADEVMDEAQVLRLYKTLGFKFEQLGRMDDAREFYLKSADLEPNNLPIRMHLFDLALRQQDDAAMRKSQEAILALVKNKKNASYLLTEVRRRLIGLGRQEIKPTDLDPLLKLTDEALLERPKWHELHITYGQLLLLQNSDIDLALSHFDKALKYGPARSNAVRLQVKLLVERGLYPQARERMERLRPGIRSSVLGQLEAEVLIKTGNPEEGFAAAKVLAEAQPENPAIQIWYSKIARELGSLDVAVKALRRALAKDPSALEHWLRMVGLLVEQKDFVEVEKVLREAHLSIEADALPLLTAKKHELYSRWQMAEDMYLAIYEGRTGDLPVAQRLADFYLLWSKKDKANLGKAAKYINQILRAANEGEVASNNPHVVWARQKAARIMLEKQDYQQSLKAERLLRQSAVNKVMNSVESELLTEILISRGDPKSLLQVKQLLTNLRKQNRLKKNGALQLAHLLARTHQWDDSEKLMQELITNYRSDLDVRTTYINLLIDQGEFSAAERSLKRLREMNPSNPNLVQLRASLTAKKGNPAELNKLLTSLLPKTRGAMNEKQLRKVLNVAKLATQHGAYEIAEKLYKTYVSRVPTETFELARFLAYHGDCGQAVEMLKRLYPTRTEDVVQLANRMLSVRRSEIGDKYDEPVDLMIKKALREDPESITRQLAQAEIYETQAKYEKSIETYEQILARDDLPARMRAAAQNNLGFQLGLLNQRVDEAEQLINDAMETFGPVEDMLDTRAVVRIAQGKYDLAIEDMNMALSVSRDPVKYFHLAKACILSGDRQAASKAWKSALDLGFEKSSLAPLEKASFDQILQRIEGDQRQSAKI